MNDLDLNPPIPRSTLDLQGRAVVLRRQGFSYEEIAEELSDESHGWTPWGVYKWCNPGKSPRQIAAWIRKHHPDPDSWLLARLAKHNPEALERMNRELEVALTKGLPWPS